MCQVATAVLDTGHLGGVPAPQLGNSRMRKAVGAYGRKVVQQHLDGLTANALNDLRHCVDHTGIAWLVVIKRRHEQLAVHAQPGGVPPQGDGVTQRRGSGGDHHLVWADAAAQHRLQQGLPLGGGEGRALARGAK